MTVDLSGLLGLALADADRVVALRHRLHREPELGLHTPRTREAVLAALAGLPIEWRKHRGTSGLVATLSGPRPGPTVLLRADMDALPLQEDTGEHFTSAHDGVMHACGHDGHTAMLVGAAHLLAAHCDRLAGRVLLMFQPGEENGARGAEHMLGEGLLDLPPHPADGSPSMVEAAYALHLTPNAPTGMVASRSGALMASSDRLLINVIGRGGHASQPHTALDPVPVACQIVQSLQTMVTRRIDVFDPAVLTVARITAGTTSNVIPERAVVEGTMRAVGAGTRATLHREVRRVAEGVAAAHGCDVEVQVLEGYGVTVNDPGALGTAMDVAAVLLGARQTFHMPNPTMGAEDFSFVLDRVPGAMLFLGSTPPSMDFTKVPSNHSNRVRHDDEALPVGAALHAALALHHLAGE